MAAAIKVMGRPFKKSGTSQESSRSRTPANSTIATKNPMPEPKVLTKAWR